MLNYNQFNGDCRVYSSRSTV